MLYTAESINLGFMTIEQCVSFQKPAEFLLKHLYFPVVAMQSLFKSNIYKL